MKARPLTYWSKCLLLRKWKTAVSFCNFKKKFWGGLIFCVLFEILLSFSSLLEIENCNKWSKKNSIHGLNSRLEGTEERISEFTDKMLEITTSPPTTTQTGNCLANVPSASWKERKRTRLKRYFFRLKVYQIWQKTQTYTVKKLTEIPPRLTQRNQH